MNKDQKSIFLFVGLMISSVSQIASHFTKMPDFVSGSLMGVGIGVILLAFIRHLIAVQFATLQSYARNNGLLYQSDLLDGVRKEFMKEEKSLR